MFAFLCLFLAGIIIAMWSTSLCTSATQVNKPKTPPTHFPSRHLTVTSFEGLLSCVQLAQRIRIASAHPVLPNSSKTPSYFALLFRIRGNILVFEYPVLLNPSVVFERGKETNCYGSPILIVTVIFLVPLPPPLPSLPSSAPIPSFPLRLRRVHDKTTRVSR